MENWGLITYRTQYLLFDELLSTEHDKMEVAIVIAHELAHQVLIVEKKTQRNHLPFIWMHLVQILFKGLGCRLFSSSQLHEIVKCSPLVFWYLCNNLDG